jgi:hypothetical protein
MLRIGPSRPLGSRVLRIAVISFLTLVAVRDASADADLDRFEALWRRGEYARVTQGLIAYRERTGIRTPQVDYMIATSACRTLDRRQLGNEFFAWILQNYNLSPQNRTLVESQRQLCSAGGAPARLGATGPAAQATAPAAMVGIAYHGKGGTDLEARVSGNGTSNSTSTMVTVIPPEQLAQRLFGPSDSTRAVRGIASLLGREFQVEAVGHFVLAAPLAVERSVRDSPDTDRPAGMTNLNAAARPREDPRTSPVDGASGQEPAKPNDAGEQNQAPMPLFNAEEFLNTRPFKLRASPNVSQSGSQPQLPNMPLQAPAPNQPASRSTTQSVRQDPVTQAQQVATATPVGMADLKNVGERLEEYLRFFVSEYGMRPPSSLITVYFARDLAQLHDLARKLHGVELAPGSIGYSFPADQSMVGWADGTAYGTFAHELFHVMVRNNFGDIPPFLDEGMAALYEVSRFEGSRAAGVRNWRGDILDRSWAERPRLRDLVQMNRSAFDDIGGQQATNHATARYWMLYLQDRGELLPVYKAFLNRRVNDHPAAQAVLLLESVLGRSLDTVDADFARWFKASR